LAVKSDPRLLICRDVFRPCALQAAGGWIKHTWPPRAASEKETGLTVVGEIVANTLWRLANP